MSGFSESIQCPNCNSFNCDQYSDYKPFSYTTISCLDCGLIINPKVEYRTLKEINQIRRDSEMKLLKKKPKQNKDVW